MTNFEKICKANPHIKIEMINNDNFRPYGEIVEGYDYSEIIAYMEKNTEIPTGCKYCPTVPEMEATDAAKKITAVYCGGMPAQFGYTNGTTSSLDALEYHKASELVIAVTDLIVLVALRSEIVNKNLDVSCVKAFYVPAGTGFEMYATTLHYAPVRVYEEGYKSVVVLPKGTNYDIEKNELDPMLWGTNKWLIAHPEIESLKSKGAACWISGDNIHISL